MLFKLLFEDGRHALLLVQLLVDAISSSRNLKVVSIIVRCLCHDIQTTVLLARRRGQSWLRTEVSLANHFKVANPLLQLLRFFCRIRLLRFLSEIAEEELLELGGDGLAKELLWTYLLLWEVCHYGIITFLTNQPLQELGHVFDPVLLLKAPSKVLARVTSHRLFQRVLGRFRLECLLRVFLLAELALHHHWWSLNAIALRLIWMLLRCKQSHLLHQRGRSLRGVVLALHSWAICVPCDLLLLLLLLAQLLLLGLEWHT